MASSEEILEEILDAIKDSNRELSGISSSAGGGASGGEDSVRSAAGGGGGSALSGFRGGLSKGFAGSLGLSGGFAGLAASAGAAVGGAAADASTAAARSFLSSGGSGAAAGGGALKSLAGAVGDGFLGSVTGASDALAVSGRAEGSVSGIVEAAARAGNPLSKEQQSGLLGLATAREERVQEARRGLSAVSDEQFGGVLARQAEGAGGRLEKAIESLVSALTQLLAGRGSI